MRVLCSFLVILLLSFSVVPQTEKSLPNFSKVNNNLYRGAQPKDVGFDELKKLGIKTVLDLRSADDRAKDEEKLVLAAGMKFFNVALDNWSRPSKEEMQRAQSIINDPANQPVFVHCKRGADRTGTVVAVFRIDHDRWTADQALDEAKKFDIGWWQWSMKDFIKDYYRDKR